VINWNAYLQSIHDTYARSLAYPLNLQVRAVECKPELTVKWQETGEKFGALEGLQKFLAEQVLLVGPAGSGKSTALEQLLLAQVERIEETSAILPIPVLAEFRYYKSSIFDPIDRFFQQHQLRLERNEIQQLLFEEKLLLLLDGVDELPSESARRDWQEFRLAYPKVPMVLTAQELGGCTSEFGKVLTMQPLTEGQMREFVGRALPDRAEELLQQLDGRLRRFGQTPLQLKMLCEVMERSQTLPDTPGLLLRQLVRADSAASGREQTDLLGRLAFRAFSAGSPTTLRLALPREEAEEVLTAVFQHEGDRATRARDELQALLDGGWLQGGDLLEFSHFLLQEYYAAERLLDLLGEIDDECWQRDYLNYLKWTNPIAYLLGLIDDIGQILRIVRLALAVDLRLGAKLAGEVKPEFQVQTVDLVAGLDVPQSLKLQLLGLTRSDAAVARLIQALDCEETKIRGVAIAALGCIASNAAIEALIRSLACPNFAVRRLAAETLGDIGSDKAAIALIEILQQDKSSLRGTAAESLGKIGSDAAIEGLIKALNDSNDFVRKIAAKSLGEIGSNRAVEGLTRALESSDAGIRWVAANALGKMTSERATEGLIRALEDDDFNIREIAAVSLGNMTSERATEGLIRALEDDDFNIREIAAESLSKMVSETAIAGLIRALDRPDTNICWIAVKALGKTRSEQAIAGLIRALDHPDASICWLAVKALEEIGSPLTVEGLTIALENPDASVRKSAVEALGEIGSDKAAEGLLQALENPDTAVRRIAAQALGKTRSELALSGLLQALDNKDAIVRKTAAEALGKNAGSELLPELAQRLKTAREPDLSIQIASAIQARYQFYNHDLYRY